MDPIRRADPQDATEICRVLHASIRRLCVEDHQNTESTIEFWTANKTEETIRGWVLNDDNLTWVNDQGNGQLGGVAMANNAGHILLLYVAPDLAGRGLGTLLMERLESDLHEHGVAELRADSTRSALEFYKRRGFTWDGSAETFGPLTSYPIKKAGAVSRTNRPAT